MQILDQHLLSLSLPELIAIIIAGLFATMLGWAMRSELKHRRAMTDAVNSLVTRSTELEHAQAKQRTDHEVLAQKVEGVPAEILIAVQEKLDKIADKLSASFHDALKQCASWSRERGTHGRHTDRDFE